MVVIVVVTCDVFKSTTTPVTQASALGVAASFPGARVGAGSPDATDLGGLRPEESVVHRRCRIMLIGNGGAGKTTLARRLATGSPPEISAAVTHGVLQRTFYVVNSIYHL